MSIPRDLRPRGFRLRPPRWPWPPLAFRGPALPPVQPGPVRMPRPRLLRGGPRLGLRLHRPRLPRPRLPRPRLSRPRLPRPRLPRPAAMSAAVAWITGGIVLFTCFLHISRSVPVNSDGAANALQAWDMLHGNLLLRGWQLSDVSFYTTELPQYMLVERLRGLGPDVVHVAAAMTYALLVVLAALLAKGKATGKQAVARILITAGIMSAPQPGTAVVVLLLSPDHVGSTVPVLLAWILLDRAPRRWYVPVAASAVLAWALIADDIVALTGLLPLAAVGAGRAYLRTARDGLRLRSSWFELSLAAAAVLAAAAAVAAVAAIGRAGGFTLSPVGHDLAAFTEMPPHLILAIAGLLLLFGASFFGQTLGYVSGLAMLHLVGLGLAGWALCSALRRLARQELAVQLVAVGTAISLAAFLFGQRAVDLDSSREFAAVLPFAAVLAGRVLSARLDRARLLPALAVVLAGYGAGLGRAIAQPAVPAANQQLASWLIQHRLDYGLAAYWLADSVTLDSGGRVGLRSVQAWSGTVAAGRWETRPSWYSPALHTANFIVLTPTSAGLQPYPWGADVRATFGQPARIYYLGAYTVLQWNKNLLTQLAPAPPPAPAPAPAASPLPGTAALRPLRDNQPGASR